MLEQITVFLLSLLDKVGYLGVMIATAIESFFPPIPSEVILVTAGAYAQTQQSTLALIGVAVFASLGNYLGTLPFYLIARYSADNLLPKFLKKWGVFLLITPEDLKKAQALFEKRGKSIVFISRLIPGIRSLIAFPAGAAKMNFTIYTIFTLAGSFFWNILLSAIGFAAYSNKDEFFRILKPIENIVIIVIAVLAILYIARVIYQIRKLRAIQS